MKARIMSIWGVWNAPVMIVGLLVWNVVLRSSGASPAIDHVGLVWTNILGVEIRDGEVIRGRQITYTNEPGDQFVAWYNSGDSNHPEVWVQRNWVTLGALSGDSNKIWLCDRLVNTLAWEHVQALTNPASFRIWSLDDTRYAGTVTPVRVWRKTRCGYWAVTDFWRREMPLWHHLYFELPAGLVSGHTYHIESTVTSVLSYSFEFVPERMRSEAVHVSQAGFRPNWLVKRAFVSCWMGDGGGIAYPTTVVFRILDAVTRTSVYDGVVELARRATEAEDPGYRDRNYTLADVLSCEFPALYATGTYCVYVEGVGCSYPFEVREDVGERAFKLMMKGLYHQRSGIALGPPYTTYERPRCFHPDDGVVVYHSTCTLMDSGNGLNALGTDSDNFGNLNAGRTTQVVANAWGGYCDAGDWDRRIQHLRVTRLLLELVELFSNEVTGINLNIPESNNGLPDVIDEALWNLDCYRRMQEANGGIRGGIESSEHPRFGDGSWQESLPVMAYAPDMWCSHIYAGDAARAAYVLWNRDAALAAVYSNSAVRAMAYAEAQWATNFYGMTASASNAVRDARNLAAIELYRLTGDPVWHDIFTNTCRVLTDDDPPEWTDYDQADALFVYVRTPGTSAALRNRFIHSLTNFARGMAWGSYQSAFGWTRQNHWIPVGWGHVTGAEFEYLVRAYVLSGDSYFRDTLIRALQFSSGANPLNMAFTVGMGTNSIRLPLKVDSVMLGVEGPEGLTTYGPLDIVEYWWNWYYQYWAGPRMYPYYTNWPVMEAYMDGYMPPDTQEYTVDRPMAMQAYAWGFLSTYYPPLPEGTAMMVAVAGVLMGWAVRRGKK